jgi:Spy/CpxP family protein refolding chaperone
MKRFGILLIVAMFGLVLACGSQEEKKAPAKPAAPPAAAEKAAPPAAPATPAPQAPAAAPAPAAPEQPGQGKGEGWAGYKEQKAQMIKELKIAPEKEKAILALEDKYAKERTGLIASMKKANYDLKASLAAANPDEAKVKELVSAITAGQDNLFASFKKQRDEEMALMTPVEQGKYLTAMSQWRQRMMEKKKESGEKK